MIPHLLRRPLSAALGLLPIGLISASESNNAPVTLRSLLEEMTSYDAIARWPAPEFTCFQASSHDRRSVAPDQDGWFANDDFSGRVRVETHAGRREEVLLDTEGPGALVRFWLTTDSNKTDGGVLRIYLDDRPVPALSFPAFDLLSGELAIPEPFLTAHPGYSRDGFGGNTMMLPIPYANRCKVTWEENSTGKRYFQINYRRYANGTDVQTFSLSVLDASRRELEGAADRLLTPPVDAPEEARTARFSLDANSKHRINLPPGPAAVRFLKFKLDSTGGAPVDRALRALIVAMTFDDEQTVWCPVGDFFGSGAGSNPMNNWYQTVRENGAMISRWVMPYARSGAIVLENLGDTPVEGTLEILTSAWTWDDRSMHFHTAWNYDANLRTPPATDWNFVTLTGRGVYAGDTLALFNAIPTWYGEGDEKIRVDGEAFPSHFGTGTEDYYNYSFAPRDGMQTPFANLTRVDHARTQGYNVMSRSRNLDGIPFRQSLDFDLELISWKPTKLIHAATSRWYAFPGGSTSVIPSPANATAPLPTLADAQRPPSAFAGVIDAELAAVVAKSPGLAVEAQNMQDFGLDIWSRDAQMLGRAGKPGDFLVWKIPAPDTSPRLLSVRPTTAPDYGILSFSVNGQRSPETFDGWSSGVAGAEEFLLGTFRPVDGHFEIRVDVTGTNPASTGARHYFGIDYFRIE